MEIRNVEFVLFGGKMFVKTLTWDNWGDHVRTELVMWKEDSRKHNINNVYWFLLAAIRKML